ncbi:hypothetical protein [Mycobacteroides abscessus]|uniref:hypothetical protein n=1 Tax=Mycobacteroides abscessus TaxID=36809 RepID=UPI0009A689B4|nr:hypothetical protein [Mycobacteroides abscessus]SLF48531.1 Uncharacterised protein [Mycobacteroides abscessus subsp. abscessus]
MSEVQIAGLRDPDMQRALSEALRARAEATRHPNPERDREQLRRLIRWVQSRVDAADQPVVDAEKPTVNAAAAPVVPSLNVFSPRA